jgi:hypothetical protein
MASPMPLLEMSPNIQESEAMCRKRSHDEFAVDVVKIEDAGEAKPPAIATIQPASDCRELTHTSAMKSYSLSK